MDNAERAALARALGLPAPRLGAVHRGGPTLPVSLPRQAMPLPGRARGPLQQAVADLPGMLAPRGLRPVEISEQIAYPVPNTYRLLQSLARAGIAEMVPGCAPQRWRLTAAHRHSPATFAQFAGRVRPGEWTTCADVSIAARGDVFAADMVCWAASHLSGFPHPHRVLLEGGAPHPDGHEHERGPADLVRDTLAREGLRFTGAGHAAPAGRVAWDQLRERIRDSTALPPPPRTPSSCRTR